VVKSGSATTVGLILNEIECRFVGPDLVGKLDYNIGLSGKDYVFHGWCRELFNHYWNCSNIVAGFE
jgi:hypothetical protein